MTETVAQGAEAILKKENSTLVKDRIAKGYRIAQIDERLRKSRTRSEANLIREAGRAGVNVPNIINEGSFTIEMGFIDGNKVRDALDKKNCKEICSHIGESVAKLHNRGIIHGDLTTSNMILKDGKIFFIDFGLGFFSQRTEDKAVDLRLLHQALESTHFEILEEAWDIILKSYKENYAGSDKVIKALSKIEKRGRYKER